MNNNPSVSILMPVYNGERYLREAVESILNQSFFDFEFIIIDDGSMDSTPRILDEYKQIDYRVIVKTNANNRGLTICLNEGIQMAKGKYIVRMDADDVSLSDRLQEQVAFMDAHPEVGVCGAWVELIGDVVNQFWKYPTHHESIHARMLFANTMVHSSIIMRTVSIKDNALLYDEQVRYAQDYELWSRAISKVRFANLNKVLLKRRIHTESIGTIHHKEQYKNHEMIYRRLLSPFCFEYSSEDIQLHQQIGVYQYDKDIIFLRRTRGWLEMISCANRRTNYMSVEVLDNELGMHWTRVCQSSQVDPLSLLHEIVTSSLYFGEKRGIHKFWHGISFCFGKIILLFRP